MITLNKKVLNNLKIKIRISISISILVIKLIR